MQICLYVDEDAMARALVRGLRAGGIDVTTVLDAGMSAQDDMVQLECATEHGRVLYTFNVGHFCQLHAQYMAQGKSHAGIIVVFRQRYAVGEQVRQYFSKNARPEPFLGINPLNAASEDRFIHYVEQQLRKWA